MGYFSKCWDPVKNTSVFCPIERCETGRSRCYRVSELLHLSFSFLNSDKTTVFSKGNGSYPIPDFPHNFQNPHRMPHWRSVNYHTHSSHHTLSFGKVPKETCNFSTPAMISPQAPKPSSVL